MTRTNSNFREDLVYSGGYAPVREIENLARKIKNGEIESVIKPLVNLQEQEDCFKIEVALPGIKREDIYIYVNENHLILIVFHKQNGELKSKLHIHEYDKEYLAEHILLPETADTEFVCAEYNEGILNLQIPKNPSPPKILFSQIGVY